MTWTIWRTTAENSYRWVKKGDRAVGYFVNQQEADAVAAALNALPDEPPAATDSPSTEAST